MAAARLRRIANRVACCTNLYAANQGGAEGLQNRRFAGAARSPDVTDGVAAAKEPPNLRRPERDQPMIKANFSGRPSPQLFPNPLGIRRRAEQIAAGRARSLRRSHPYSGCPAARRPTFPQHTKVPQPLRDYKFDGGR